MPYLKLRGRPDVVILKDRDAERLQSIFSDPAVEDSEVLRVGLLTFRKREIALIIPDEDMGRADQSNGKERFMDWITRRNNFRSLSAREKAERRKVYFQIFYFGFNYRMPDEDTIERATLIAEDFFEKNPISYYPDVRLWKPLLDKAALPEGEKPMRVNTIYGMQRVVERAVACDRVEEVYDSKKFGII